MSTWYRELDFTAPIDQGDLLFDFPILGVEPNVSVDDVFSGNSQSYIAMQLSETDVVVVSQACDIQNKKIPFLVLAQIWDANKFIPREEQTAINPNDARGRRKQFLKTFGQACARICFSLVAIQENLM